MVAHGHVHVAGDIQVPDGTGIGGILVVEDVDALFKIIDKQVLSVQVNLARLLDFLRAAHGNFGAQHRRLDENRVVAHIGVLCIAFVPQTSGGRKREGDDGKKTEYVQYFHSLGFYKTGCGGPDIAAPPAAYLYNARGIENAVC